MRGEDLMSRKDIENALNEKLDKMDSRKKEAYSKIVQKDLMTELCNNLKNLTSAGKERWKKLIKKLKNYVKIFGENDSFSKFIAKILPLLGAYLGSMLTMNCCNEAIIDACEPEVLDADGNVTDITRLERLRSYVPDEYLHPDSEVLEFCKNELYGFSLYPKDTSGEYEQTLENNEDCKISLCPPKVESNINGILSNNILSASKGIIIEYDHGYQHNITVNPGSIISGNEYIGTINRIPVNSQVHGLITEKTNNYFIAEYVDDASDLDLEAMAASATNERMEKICDLFTDNANAVNFIKDYLMYMRLPHLAAHTEGGILDPLSEVSSTKYIKKYRKKISDELDAYNKRTKKKCKPENIESHARKNTLPEFKKELDDDKRKTFEKFMYIYNNYKELGYHSKGRISDFMLCDEYMDYLTDEELFYYDDNNPYVVRLFKMISKFIGKRILLEKNKSHMPSLIEKFNSKCKEALFNYWRPEYGDYYASLSETFKYDYYTNDIDKLIEAAVTDTDKVSLFSKVKDYLSTKAKYTKPSAEAYEYSDDIDIKAILKEKKEKKDDPEIEKRLKQISIEFCMLRTIETNFLDESIFNTVAKKSNVEAFRLLHLIAPTITEYKENYIGIDPLILVNRTMLDKYLTSLKAITDAEIEEMDALADEVMRWYNENGEKVNDLSIFNEFREIAWGTPSTIYKDGDQYDFIYLKYYEQETLDNIKDNLEPFDFDNDDTPDSYYNTEAYLNTGAGPNNLLYWFRYLGMATLVNCMIPIYWSTGLIIAGVPVLLPIIMLPIFVLPGKVTVVFGVGLCGVCPMPLILFCNMNSAKSSIIVPLNILADTVKTGLNKIILKEKDLANLQYKPVIEGFDAKINKTKSELEEIEDKIQNLDSYVKNNKRALRQIQTALKRNSTTQTTRVK